MDNNHHMPDDITELARLAAKLTPEEQDALIALLRSLAAGQ